MANHRRQNKTTTRRLATASAVAVGATLLAPGVANAAPVEIANTGFVVDVPGAEDYINTVEQYAPGSSELVNVVSGQAAEAGIPAAPVQSDSQRIVDIAQSKIGAPYVYGAAGPDAFDCSGFTSWVYSQVGKSIPRTSQAQAAAGQPVAKADLQPGDIVSFYGGASHVGIYIGNGQIIDALNSGTPVGVRPLDMMPFNSAVRF